MTISKTVKKYLPEDTTTKSKILKDIGKTPEDTTTKSKILKPAKKPVTYNH